MSFSDWRQRRLEEKRDRQEFELMLSYAPSPEQEAIAAERLAEVEAMTADLDAQRRYRQELAGLAEWADG